jgi:hypothetical protein
LTPLSSSTPSSSSMSLNVYLGISSP